MNSTFAAHGDIESSCRPVFWYENVVAKTVPQLSPETRIDGTHRMDTSVVKQPRPLIREASQPSLALPNACRAEISTCLGYISVGIQGELSFLLTLTLKFTRWTATVKLLPADSVDDPCSPLSDSEVVIILSPSGKELVSYEQSHVASELAERVCKKTGFVDCITEPLPSLFYISVSAFCFV